MAADPADCLQKVDQRPRLVVEQGGVSARDVEGRGHGGGGDADDRRGHAETF